MFLCAVSRSRQKAILQAIVHPMSQTITNYIRQDLETRLRRGTDLPDKLTLAALSAHYSVSLTPVRLAVRELLDGQLLCKGNNGRLTVGPAVASKPSTAQSAYPARPSEAHDLESALTDEIIKRGLRGEEEYLREEATADQFGVGRTVLRQGLLRLAGKGLIEHLPRRGWRVRRFDAGEMTAYLQVRESLELKALELAQPNLDAGVLRKMLVANRPGSSGADRLDNDLHAYLIATSGNRFIREFFDRQGVYFDTLFNYAAPEANVVRAMARQHRSILRALIARDWRAARKALAQHIRAQGPIVERLLERVRNEGQK
jgi:DNA-binding GntR family transcriptional regulator